MTLETDVIVVGGGVAGLAAVVELSGGPARVLLIEGRDRLGGRILTDTSGDAAVDVGAEFIHGREPTLMEYLRKRGLAHETADATDYYFDGETLARTDEGGDDSPFEMLSQLSEDVPDQSFAAYAGKLSLDPGERSRLTGYVQGFNAADASVISIRALARQQHAEDAIDGGHSSRLVNGYADLVEALIEDCRTSDCGTNFQIVMGTAIEEIDWRMGRVQVAGRSANRDPFRAAARAVVVTVPLPMLSKLRFIPPIPLLAELPAALRMGPAVRLTLQMKEPWWEAQAPGMGFLFAGLGSGLGEAALGPAGPGFPVFWVNRRAPVPLITAWSGGPAALEFQGLSIDKLVHLATQNLARLFGLTAEAIASLVTRAYFHDWLGDPFSGGAYSYVAAGGLAVAERFARPVEDTVWFAGEATASEGHWGTVHGAFSSGIRAAREIREKLSSP